MKRNLLLAVAVVSSMAASQSFAASFTIDFEKNWDYANGDVNGYYNGGAAADGTTGANLGVSFVGISGLSNDADFTYYLNAPSMVGTAYAHTFAVDDKAYMNVAAGVDQGLSFYYSSAQSVAAAVKVYAGLNGTGALLGTFDLAANSSDAHDVWTPLTIGFSGTAMSFDFTGSANVVGIDNVRTVPVPSALVLLGSALLGVPGLRRKVRQG